MKLEMMVNDRTLYFDLSKAINISIPIKRQKSVSSFGIAGATYQDYEVEGFVGNKNRGGTVNLETVTFTAHGNGSHTECYGHISFEPQYVNACIEDTFYLSRLMSVPSKKLDSGLYLDFSGLDLSDLLHVNALIIRTLPNLNEKTSRDYSGRDDVPAIHPKDMKILVDAGIDHLLVDLPSVDPEWDNGALASHHIFWQYPESPRTHASITEFVFIDNSIVDDLYALKLNISNFISDAAPSTPTLYPAI